MKSTILILILVSLVGWSCTGCKSVAVRSAKIDIQNNDYESAKRQLNEGLKQNPNDAEAHYLLGEIYSHEKNFPEMLKAFDAYMALDSKHKDDLETTKRKHFNDLYNSAVNNFQTEKYQEAVTELKSAILILPNTHKAWSLMGKSYYNLRDYPNAVETLKQANSLDPKFEEIRDRELVMSIYDREGQIEAALNLAEEILRKDAGNQKAIAVAASCYNQLALKTDDTTKRAALQNKALGYYQKVLETHGNNPDMHFNLAILLEEMGRLDEAIAEYQKTLELNDQDIEATKKLAEIYLIKKEDNLENNLKAIEYLKKSLENSPDDYKIWLNLSAAQYRAAASPQVTDNKQRKALLEEALTSKKKAEELQSQK